MPAGDRGANATAQGEAADGGGRRYLALLRHAEPERVGGGSLTARGRAQAQATGRYLARLAPERVISSGVPRAVETAVGLGFAAAPEVDERFHGLRIDRPDGEPLATFDERAALYADPDAAPYGGESLADLLARGRPAFDAAVAAGGGVVVAHDMIDAVLIADVLGIDLRFARKLAQDHCASNLFELRETGPDLIWMNVTPEDPLRLRAGNALPDASVERRLYLVRHGEAWNFPSAGGRLASVSGHDLTETGFAQAQALGGAFAELEAPAIFASDLPRAAQTAAGLAAGRRVTPHAGLREIDVGELDGLSVRELFERCPGFLSDPDAPIPGGETATECADRVEAAARAVLARTTARDVVIVAHGAVNRLLAARMLGLPVAAGLRLRTDWASVSMLEYARGEWWARCLNWTPEGLGAFDRLAPIEGLTAEQARVLGR
jgi:broad specificity phosphatase PhoE